MKQNKHYTITFLRILAESFVSIFTTISVIVFIIATYHAFRDKTSIFVISSLIILLLSLLIAYAFYPLYIVKIYYKTDKNHKITIDYLKNEICLIDKNTEQIIQCLNFDEIAVVKEYYGPRWGRGPIKSYYKIIPKEKDAEPFIFTCLLVPEITKSMLPNVNIERIYSNNLIPHKEAIKKEEDDYFDDDNSWNRF